MTRQQVQVAAAALVFSVLFSGSVVTSQDTVGESM